MKTKQQIQFKINQLLYVINSRYGAFGEIYPTDVQIVDMYKQIQELRKQL